MRARLFMLTLLMAGSSASAEIIYCRFESGAQPITFTKYNTVKKTLYVLWGWPQQEVVYQEAIEDSAETGIPVAIDGPYAGKKKSKTIKIFGDVPALYIRRTNNGTLQGDPGKRFPYEAYMAEIPGRLKSNWLDNLLGHQWGPRGACWTKALPGEQHQGGGDGGGHDGHSGDCGPGGHGGHSK